MKEDRDPGSVGAEIYLPSTASEEDLWLWYLNLPIELGLNHLAVSEREIVRDYYQEAGLLRPAKINFFRAHFVETFARASNYLLTARERPTVLDLGCGTGTQALYLALRGARVIGVDLDRKALDIVEKRASFYSEKLGRSLAVETICGNAHAIDYTKLGPIDGVYSMFAFNMMRPSDDLLHRILPSLSAEARLAIIDGNNRSWLARFVPSRRRDVWSPEQFAANLAASGFVVEAHEGGIALPPFLWRLPLGSLLRTVDGALRKHWFFAVSHQILARRL